MLVYIQDVNGQPLMPTSRCGKVRRLLKDKKAKAPKPNGNAPIQPSQGGGILTQIIGYNLSEHTAIDNHQFILSLQQQVASIL